MRIEETMLKVWTGFLVYMIAYNGLALVIHDLNVSLFQWFMRPIVDLYHLNIIAIVMLVFSMTSFFITSDIVSKKSKLKELRKVGKKCDEGREFHYAISILRDSRFSYVLGQNSIIELNSMEYLYYNLRYLRLSLELF
ncbi:MAG: hypothetical protein KAS66_03515 [Candidatus Omnitrophica bacterium]|nr:hypothetical protein [Candidatus Omnitrophota bacterium]